MIGRALGTLLMLAAWPSYAFSLESVATDGCHERLTLEALTRAGWATELPVLAASAHDARLRHNLPFAVPVGADARTLALLIGVRDNDLHGASLVDLPELAAVHEGPNSQSEHCLRGPADDFAEGDRHAIAACKAFILEQTELALGDADQIDPTSTQPVRLALSFETREVELSTHAFQLGRALHALQDSYSHSYRAPGFRGVLSVFNYVEAAVSPAYALDRDGEPHLGQLDQCEGSSEFDRARLEEVAQTSADYLAAVASPVGGRSGRLERVKALLDERLSYTPGCGPDNDFCGSIDAYHVSPARGCSATSQTPWPLLFTLLVLLGPLWGRRRHAR